MPPKPAFNNLRLEPCCQQALREINNKVDLGKKLQAIVAVSPFITMFASRPVNTLYTVLSTDWNNLTAATKAVPGIVRSRCRTVAELHWLDHADSTEKNKADNNQALSRFWEAMAKSFN